MGFSAIKKTMKRTLDSVLVECNEDTQQHQHSECLGNINKKKLQEVTIRNFPTVANIYNITYKVMDYNVFYESRGKTLLSCTINNVDCIVKRVKQHEGVKSILSLYLPSDNPDYCFTLKGTCLGTMFRNGQVDQIDIFQFVKDLLGTLVLLERGNITHNDIKPDNIVLYDGHWFLIDYELSKSFKLKRGKYFDCNNGKLRCERFSRGYRPPERINSLIISPRSDIYSLGLVILELLHQKRLDGLEDPSQVQQHLQQAQQEGIINSNMSSVDKEMKSCLLHEILPQMLIQKSNKRPTPTCLLETLNNHCTFSDFSNTLSFFLNADHFRNQLFSIS